MNKRRNKNEFMQQFTSPSHIDLIRQHFPDCCGGATILEGGEDNVNLLFEDEPCRVARHYLISSPSKVAAERALVSKLAAQGFPTPVPIQTQDGSFFLNRGDEPAVAVFPFVEGAVELDWSLGQKQQTAALIARMHKICKDFSFALGTTKPRLDILHFGFKKVASLGLPGHEMLSAEVNAFLERFSSQRVAFETLPFGPVHHDLNRGNVIWRNNQVAALIDFDECHDAPLIMDLAAAFHYLAVNNAGQLDVASCAAIFEGYQQVRELLPIELTMLPMAWDLFNLTSAVEFIIDNCDQLNHVEECLSLSKFYIPLKGQLAAILINLA